MCGKFDNYLPFWQIQPGHALIYPVFSNPDATDANGKPIGTDMDLAEADQEWFIIIYNMAIKGVTVNEAVVLGNGVADANHANHHWAVKGDGGNVSFFFPSK
jgi:hypothetical protein